MLNVPTRRTSGLPTPRTESVVELRTERSGPRAVDHFVAPRGQDPQRVGQLLGRAPSELPRRQVSDETANDKPSGFLTWLNPVGFSRNTAGAALTAVAATPVVLGMMTTPSEAATAARSIDGVAVTLAPTDATPAEQFAHYESIVEAMGGRIETGRTHVLGLRGVDPDGTVHATRSGRTMNDTFVVLRRDADGSVQVDHFRGSTHPSVARSRQSPDVDRDGVRDVGMIREGRFSVAPNGWRDSGWSYHIRTTGGSGALPGARDTDHDGRYSHAEWQRAQTRGHRLTEVLFHPGTPRGNASSVGCLNVRSWNAFIASVGGRNTSFDFTLVNAHSAEI
ncbi:MAG: hypothetical protein HY791_24370 [Deltaproteobacteria bacterium]|nr:hypothetical protein [Deltaproteobacteria bacterium]